MTDVTWLEGRHPPPPEDLLAQLEGDARVREDEDAVAELLAAARAALGRALDQPGRVRAAAFDLLASDAWVTYACEAALESGDPDAELDRLVSIGGPA